jgi:asparagine synthase (glutamine-hydrolysing)
MAGCLRDASPDAWGRRVIINRLTGLKGPAAGAIELDELTYLLESGSDRIGGLDFQARADAYIPRAGCEATLEELQASAEKVLAGEPLHPEIDRALNHGSSIGGARPKALLASGDRKLIAKFSATSDTYSVVKAEYIAMRLAALRGAVCERVVMGQSDFWTLAPRIAAAVDDPTADAAVLPTWMLGRAARRAGLKVTLCGEGADELLGGYVRYRRQRLPWRWLSRPPRSRPVLGEVAALSDWRRGLAAAEAVVGQGRSPVQAAQAADIAEWLPNDLLVKLDRCLMAHGVEGRTPFLDAEVANFAFRLPDRLKVGVRFGKVLLRRWLANAFPEARAFARKKGFKPPVGAWIAGRAGVVGPLLAAQPGLAGLLPPAEVTARLQMAQANPQPAWSLLFYGLWHSAHILGVDPSGGVEDVLRAAAQRN